MSGSGQDAGEQGGRPRIPQLRLDDLLAELQSRLQNVLATRDRAHALLEAVVTIGTHLDQEVVLRQIVEAAVRLVDCQYGALGVVGEGGKLIEFVPVGVDEKQIRQIDHWPEGHGLLGELISNPQPLRLADMSADPRSAGFPEGHPPMKSFLGAPVRIRDEIYGNLYLTEKRDGAQFDEDDEALLLALAAAAGVAIDNAQLYAEARRQQQWLRANAEVTQRLLSEQEPGQVLEFVTQQAMEMSRTDLVVLALPVGSPDQLVVEHAVGTGADEALGLVLPAQASASGLVMASGKPITVADFSSDPRVAKVARDNLQLGPAVLVPLGSPGNVRGVLTAGRHRGSMPLSPSAVEMLVTFAAQAGIGLELAEHRRDTQRLALFEDRDRIARDLHDFVIQRLFATGMSLQGSSGLIGDPEAAGRVRQAVDALDETIRDIRSAIFTLQSRPASGTAGVRAQVLTVIEEMTGPLGFQPTARIDERLDTQIPGDIAGHLLAALREALSNVARHAQASQVAITIDVGPELVLTVRDNGRGIGDTSRRSGLGNLSDRAKELGGTLRIDPDDGGGTLLDWRIPLPTGRQPGS
ncbi:MAG TPA: GAF domain-containing protein [Streptosporangiaceae bacterium]|jgi:signal transduction histidine kinase